MDEIDAVQNNEDAMTADDTEIFDIKICNEITGAREVVPVYGSNTLGQVARGYGKFIGLESGNSRFMFCNPKITPKRFECDLDVTVTQFGISPGDRLIVTWHIGGDA